MSAYHYPRSALYLRFAEDIRTQYRSLKAWHFLSASSLGEVMDGGLAAIKLVTLVEKVTSRRSK